MSEEAGFVRASFTLESGPLKDQPFDVHFNPTSLSYTITNAMESEGEGEARRQFVAQSTGKLTMDLVFDTTDTGEDVRVHTEKVAKTMEPDPDAGRVPPIVKFTWGVYTFRGMVEGYKETLDFFAPTGIPLRAAVNLTLSSQEKVFDADTGGPVNVAGALKAEPVKVPTKPGAGGAADVAKKAGKPAAARQIAAANGLESVRFSSGGSLSVGAAAKGGASPFSAGGGIGGAVSVKAGAGPVPSAFAGLRAGAKASVTLNPASLLPPAPSKQVATGGTATFGIGGKASVEGSASLKADVGATASLRTRIRFGEG